MSTMTATAPGQAGTAAAVRNWKTPAILSVLAVLALLAFAIGAPANDVTFRLSDPSDAVVLPDLVLSAPLTGWICAVLMLAAAVLAVMAARAGRRVPGWLPAVFAALFVAGFLAWV
ncbi:ABC transporter permease, partial [Arthrobacter deserti]|nr:ABC transporter permease [Arthrobacter deserti]